MHWTDAYCAPLGGGSSFPPFGIVASLPPSSVASSSRHTISPSTLMVLSPNEETPSNHSRGSEGRLSRASKDILFGSIAGMVAKVFEHPFDLIKVRLQTQPFSDPGLGNGKPKGTLYRGAFDAFRLTIKKEGLIGLFRGISMPILGATLENATLFFTYNALQGQIRKFNDGQGRPSISTSSTSDSATSSSLSSSSSTSEVPLSLPQLAIAAAGAGAVTSFALTPIELIKCRMQVQMISAEAAILAREASGSTTGSPMAEALKAARRSLPGPIALVKETLRKEGIRGLWLGQTGTLLRETGGGMAWFLAFESVSRWFLRRRRSQDGDIDGGQEMGGSSKLHSWQLIVAGAMAGVSYNVILFPADSVKSTIQTEAELSPKGTKPSSFLTTLKRIYTKRGVAGLYAGCGITCLRSGPSSALIFLLYNRLEGFAEKRGW